MSFKSSNAAPPHAQTTHKKLPKLPKNAKISKRPLPRPSIPSPYTAATTTSNQKVVYISTRTPFLSAVKRVEKLLHLADKRAVQSAATRAKTELSNSRKRKRGGGDGEDLDEIGMIARLVEEDGQRKKTTFNGKGGDEGELGRLEEVHVKGTGKAIQKVMQIGLWFQQREERFRVRLRTGTVGGVDDVVVPEEEEAPEEKGGENDEEGEGGKDEDAMDVDAEGQNDTLAGAERDKSVPPDQMGSEHKGTPGRPRCEMATSGARIRYNSMLEVCVSLR